MVDRYNAHTDAACRRRIEAIARRHLDVAPLTARERGRLTRSRDFAGIDFLDEDLARKLPRFSTRPAPLVQIVGQP